MNYQPYILLLMLLVKYSNTVDKSKFKTCDQSGFCKRQRSVLENSADYEVDLSSGVVNSNGVNFPQVINIKNGIKLVLQVLVLEDNTFRFKLNEASPLYPRYEVEHALLPSLKSGKFSVEKGVNFWSITSNSNKVKVYKRPFRIEVYSGDNLVTVVNGRGTLKFEYLRKKADVNDEPVEAAGNEVDEGKPENDDTGESMWEESFGSHRDSKPRGPESIGVDIDFPHTRTLYGIPEHADSFVLRDTKEQDPFRLYNLDVFEYELFNPMALYGSVPYVIAHSPVNTVGVLWLNGAETWVDVDVGGAGNLVDSIVNLVGAGKEEKDGKTRWMSESGIIDILVFMGPKPIDVFRQYGVVAGNTPIPQKWAIASQQCRWNYNDEEDVKNVDEGFDFHDIPYDSLWLDIEHTDGKKYFTWDKHKFAHPIEMIQNISAKGRKMVTIIDPHIKRDTGYFLHDDALANDLYVKDKDGKVYEGWCWPGSSSYLDFFDPKVREYWASRFELDKYESTLDLYTWNDMNEPSVFNGPEVTMHKDLMHYGNWEHRDVHNLYGLMNVMATFEGHLKRSDGKLRPFILTRSHFVGSQRYAAVWTGDNHASWEHLKMSIPMCLSLSITGISHCGADIGGFFGNPDAELMVRWYQTAAFQPFMRNHAHIETKRREPWLFGDKNTALIRSAVRKRYALLPYWYTLFYQNEMNGTPPMRPLWAHYPDDEKTFAIEDQYLVGENLLVHPISDAGATSVKVYLPRGIWYDFYSYIKYSGESQHNLAATDDTIPVFQRGGSIIPTKQRIRRSSSLMKNDPYTLFVACDENGEASGSLYIDDGESFDYRSGKYIEISFSYKGNTLEAKVVNSNTVYKTSEWLERVVILGLSRKPSSILVKSHSVGTKSLESEGSTEQLVIRKPAVLLSENWQISLEF